MSLGRALAHLRQEDFESLNSSMTRKQPRSSSNPKSEIPNPKLKLQAPESNRGDRPYESQLGASRACSALDLRRET
jgi:hypothetical protein